MTPEIAYDAPTNFKSDVAKQTPSPWAIGPCRRTLAASGTATVARSAATAGSPEKRRAPFEASAPAVAADANAAHVESFSSFRPSRCAPSWPCSGGRKAWAVWPATASRTKDASRKIVSVSWWAARGTDPKRAAVNVMTPKDSSLEKTRTRTGPAKALKDRPSNRRCVFSRRRTYARGRLSPAFPSFRAASLASKTHCTTCERAVASAAPRTPRPSTPTAIKSPTIFVPADAPSAIRGALESLAPSSAAVRAFPSNRKGTPSARTFT